MDTSIFLIGGAAGAVLVAIFAIGLTFARLYTRASQDTAFVRTGLGGSKVIVEGGAVVLPVVHEIRRVSLRTHKLEVARRQGEGLITKDSLRADVSVEFFVRVKKEVEEIKKAAQTLGDLTNDPVALKKLVEGKFVDALRAVAATMELSELHVNRVDFVQAVRASVAEDLSKNGLELESASLVGLDQTSLEHLNPENTFDAVGSTKVKAIVEARRRERFEIEQSTEVAIAEKRRDAKMQTLNIDRETQNAEATQRQEIAQFHATSQAAIAESEADSRRKSETSRIASEQAIEEGEVKRKAAVDIARQDAEARVFERSETVSAAEAKAADAKAAAVTAEEKVHTAKAVEIAERSKAVEMVSASQAAEREAIKVTVSARAEKESAETRAEAIKTVAEAEAEAAKTRAAAQAKTYEVEAAGRRALNEAQNLLSAEVIAFEVRKVLLERLPAIIEASVRPLENIDSMKIVEVGGLNGLGGGAGGEGSAQGGSLPDQLVASALRHRAQAPLVDSLLAEVGISGGSLSGLVAGLAQPAQAAAPKWSPEAETPAGAA